MFIQTPQAIKHVYLLENIPNGAGEFTSENFVVKSLDHNVLGKATINEN